MPKEKSLSTEPDPLIVDTMQMLLRLGILDEAKHELSSGEPWWIRCKAGGWWELHLSDDGAKGFAIGAELVLGSRPLPSVR